MPGIQAERAVTQARDLAEELAATARSGEWMMREWNSQPVIAGPFPVQTILRLAS